MSDRDPEDKGGDALALVPVAESNRRVRRVAPKRASRGWSWTKSGGARCRVEGTYPDGEPYKLDKVVPYQSTASDPREATARAADAMVDALRKLALARCTGEVSRASRMTLNEWRESGTRGGHLPAMTSSERSFWRRWVARLGKFQLQQLHAARINEWLRWMTGTGKLGPSSVRRAHGVLRGVLGRAVDARVIERLPWSGDLRDLPVAGKSLKARALEDHELRAVATIAMARDQADRERGLVGDLTLRLALACELGARPSELGRIEPADMWVDGDGRGWVRAAVHKKRVEARIVREIPAALARACARNFEALSVEARRVGVLFPRKQRRGRWCERSWQEHVGKSRAVWRHEWLTWTECLALKVAVSDFTVYQMRHTAITAWAALVESEIELALRSGHEIGSRAMRGYMDRAKLTRGLAKGRLVGAGSVGLDLPSLGKPASLPSSALNGDPSDADNKGCAPPPANPPKKQAEKRARRLSRGRAVAAEPIAPWEICGEEIGDEAFSPENKGPASGTIATVPACDRGGAVADAPGSFSFGAQGAWSFSDPDFDPSNGVESAVFSRVADENTTYEPRKFAVSKANSFSATKKGRK